jgi:CRP-like cAMP-binding protein
MMMRRSLLKRVDRFTTSSCQILLGRQTTRFFSSATTSATTTKISSKAATATETSKAATTTTTTTKGVLSILPLDPAVCERAKPWLHVIGHASYLALASGFLMTDMFHLRVALVGGYTGLVTFHALHPKPLWIPLRWSALFIIVNAGAACMLAADRWCPPLSEEDETLYLEQFPTLTRSQFYQLLSLGTIQENIPDGRVLTVEGEVCENLYFVQKGRAKVYHRTAFAANIDKGGFVNDVAFQIGEGAGAYGTVITSGKCSLIMWNESELRDHLRSRPEMDRNMKYCLSNHFVKSLLRQREAAHERQRLVDQLSRRITASRANSELFVIPELQLDSAR